MAAVNSHSPAGSPWPARAFFLVLGCVLTALQFGGNKIVYALRYDRDFTAWEGWWRFLGASFVHVGWAHLALNLAALAVVALVVERGLNAAQATVAWFISSLATTLGLWHFNPGIEWYVGASGALHGLLLAGAMPLAFRGNTTARAVVLLMAIKLLWEQRVGPMPGSESAAGVAVIVDAHLYGALGGILALLPNHWIGVRHPAIDRGR